MIEFRSTRERFPLLPLMAGLSRALGLIVPSIYELGQKPASRHRYEGLEQLAVGVLAITIVWCVALEWQRRRRTWPAAASSPAAKLPTRRLQFGLRTIFAVMTVTAVTLAAASLLDVSLHSTLILVLVLGIAGWSLPGDRRLRSRFGAVLSCAYFPFAWLFAFNRPIGHTSGLIELLPLGPGILPAELLRSLIGLSRAFVEQGAFVWVVVQLLLGGWLSARGGRLFWSYLVLVCWLSGMCSLVLHALYRA